MQKEYFKLIAAAFALVASLYCQGLYAQQATATIHYDQPTGRTIHTGAFGLNLFRGFDPNTSGTPGNDLYKAGMTMMKPGIVRYHSWEMFGSSSNPNGWLKDDNQWDAVKIDKALTGAIQYPLTMINIPAWPAVWQDADEKLLPQHYNDYANWCASLVKIINVDQKRGFTYWEVTNERDDRYQENSDELGRIFNLAAAAMKAVDPTIKVGGPACARPDLIDRVEAFFSTAAPQLDFVSYHSYANGSPNAPVNEVYDRAEFMGRFTADMRAAFEKYSTRPVEYFHDEYNISWNPPDPHQSSHVSMLFDAIFMVTAVKEGATGTMAWNEADGWYGKMGGNFDLRPSAHMFGNFNNHLIGGAVNQATVSDASSLVVLASTKGSLRQLVVINRSGADQYYRFTFNGLPATVNSSTLFKYYQNIPTGGTTTGQLSHYQLTNSKGALFAKNTVTILEIDLNNLISTGDTKPPHEPKSLRATARTEASITLSWKAAHDKGEIKKYEIFQNGQLIGSSQTTSFTATWLDPSTSYSYNVKAYDATGYESPLSKTLVVSTRPYTPNPVPSTFNATTWINHFSGNVLSDAGQTTTGSPSAALRQNEEMRMILKNTPQHAPVYTVDFTNTIDISYNTRLNVEVKSDTSFALRAKLFDDQNRVIDAWQNYIYLNGDNNYHTYTISFSNAGFGSVDPTRIKGIQFIYPDGGVVGNATLFFDNLQLGGAAPAFEGNYKIIAKHSGKAVTVPGASTQDGIQLAQYSYAEGAHQQWAIIPVGGGYYKLIAKHSNKAMHVENGSAENGARIQQWTDNGTDAQKWSIEQVSEGNYKIISKSGGKSFDVGGYSLNEGAQILQWDYFGSDNQTFQIVSVAGAAAGRRGLAEGKEPETSAIGVYPNPASDKVTIHFSLEKSGSVRLAVLDYLSRNKLSLTHAGQAGSNRVELSLNNFENGFYLITVTTGNKTITKKIIVRK